MDIAATDSKVLREKWLDILRVGATCAVVMLHTVSCVSDRTDMSRLAAQNKIFLISKDMLSWGVPVFLIISGYLFLNPKKQISMHTIIFKYCRRIILALFVFGVPYAFLEQIVTTKSIHINMVFQAFIMVLQGKSWSHLWYLYLIIVLYLLTPLFKKLLSVIPRWSVILIMTTIFTGSSIMVFLNLFLEKEVFPVLPCDLIYVFYYLYGYILVTKKENKNDKKYYFTLSTLLPTALLILLYAGVIISRLSDTYTIQMAYSYPPTVISALLLVFFIRKRRDSGQPPTKRLMQLSEISFTVYLIHPVFLNIVYKGLNITPLSFSLYWSLPLFWAGAIFTSVLGALVLQRIPFLKKYIL